MAYQEFSEGMNKLINSYGDYGEDMLLIYLKNICMENPEFYHKFTNIMFNGIQEKFRYLEYLHSECQVVAFSALHMVEKPNNKKNEDFVNAIKGRLNPRVLNNTSQEYIGKLNEKFGISKDESDDKDAKFRR